MIATGRILIKNICSYKKRAETSKSTDNFRIEGLSRFQNVSARYFFEKFPLYNLPDRKKDYIVLTKI